MTTSPALLTDAEMEQLCNGALPKTRYCRGFREYGRAVEAAVTARLKDALTASNERNAQLSRLLLDQDREGAALPFDAWAEYAMREGLLDMKGIATDRKTTGTAFAAFAAGWNAAKGAAAMEGDGGLSDGVMAVPANCRQCGRQLRLDGLCVECDYSDGVAAVPMADLPGMARYGAMQAALDALEKSVDNFPANVQHRAAIDALRVALGVLGTLKENGNG